MPAIGPHSTSTVERTWDGPAPVAAMGNNAAFLRYAHAWYAGENPDQKSSYKFPHHGPRSGSPAVLAGVRNALARLSGASIPDADSAGVERHLRGHLGNQEE